MPDRSKESPSSSVQLRNRRTAAKRSEDPEEIYAEEFAACLLMPKEAMEHEWKELDSHNRQPGKGIGPIIMAVKFGVPVEEMTDRLVNLGLWKYPSELNPLEYPGEPGQAQF